MVPDYINRNAVIISSWEAEGRYDIHVVVKITQLKKCYSEVTEWYRHLVESGYK
jgi:hypothetical protein